MGLGAPPAGLSPCLGTRMALLPEKAPARMQLSQCQAPRRREGLPAPPVTLAHENLVSGRNHSPGHQPREGRAVRRPGKWT